ncbi:MAG: amino acid permease [Solirubrobacterales bacterium]|nr:amino acid permease [Solirubrobacterales bacterium]
MARRSIGSPTLFAVIYTSVASAIYFALGVVADHALGLTPVVFLAAGGFFTLCVMTYVEGASLHQERAGSTVFARYAFNELWSFVAGWAILLDFLILIAVTTHVATDYLAVLWGDLGSGAAELVLTFVLLTYVAVRNIRGFSVSRARRIAVLVGADLAVQALIIVLGLAIVFDPDVLTGQVQLGTTPPWREVVYALTLATVAFTSLESASGLAGEVAVGRRGLRRLVSSATLVVTLLYVGIGLVAITAVPVVDGEIALGGDEAPLLAVVAAFEPAWLADGLRYVVGVLATVTLVAAANAAMLGLSRLGYQLGTNRQIPASLARLHPARATPYVLITLAAVLACVLALTRDLDFLVGMYAFGALLGFLIAHLSIIRLRFREPERARPYRIPLNVDVRGIAVPLPAVLGALVSAAAWISVLVLHDAARWAGLAWMVCGLVLYVVYRTTQGKPLFQRVVVPEAALRDEPAEAQYGSILVPLFGSPLDDDIVQTAGRLAAEDREDDLGGAGATIEALWVFEVPMSLPIDARLPEVQLRRARTALSRAKAIGEEYEGVEVATATVRARRAGEAIVDEARRRGVEAIVLAAEEPSRIRGGSRFGGRGGPLDDFVGAATKHVVQKAPCRVILTAPPAEDMAAIRQAQADAVDGAPPPEPRVESAP